MTPVVVRQPLGFPGLIFICLSLSSVDYKILFFKALALLFHVLSNRWTILLIVPNIYRVSHYFQRDLLESTKLTFGQPETDFYNAFFLIPTTSILFWTLVPQTLFHQHEFTDFRDMGISQRSVAMALRFYSPVSAYQGSCLICPQQHLGLFSVPPLTSGMCPVLKVGN